MAQINLFERSQTCLQLSTGTDTFLEDTSIPKRNNPLLERFRASIKTTLFIEDVDSKVTKASSANSTPLKLRKNLSCKIESNFQKETQCKRTFLENLGLDKSKSSTQPSLLSLSNNNSPDFSSHNGEHTSSKDRENNTETCLALSESPKLEESKQEMEVANTPFTFGNIDPEGSDSYKKSESEESREEEDKNFVQDQELEQEPSSLKHSIFLQDTILSELEELKEEFKINKNSSIYFIEGDFWNYYKEEDVLGEGTSGLVKRCIKIETDEVYAVKIIQYRGDRELLTLILNEFENLKKLDHKNIIKVYELYVDYFKKKVYTVMELADCKEMFAVLEDLGHYSEAIASGIMKQILTGLNYLHSHGVCHRDIKPNNILVSKDGNTVKITDFNVSKFLGKKDLKRYSSLSTENYKMWTHTGTIAFSAPEVFLDSEYTESVDVWSAGVVMYTMLCGYQPFQSDNVQELIETIKEANYTFYPEQWNSISDQAKDLIKHCLDVDTKTRYSPSDALMHPWIAHHGNVSDMKIALRDEFRVYYKKQKDGKDDQSDTAEMKKVQVISPSLAKPVTRLNRKCTTTKITVEEMQAKSIEYRKKGVRMVQEMLPNIEENHSESQNSNKKDEVCAEKAQDFRKKINLLTCSMIKEDLGLSFLKKKESMILDSKIEEQKSKDSQENSSDGH